MAPSHGADRAGERRERRRPSTAVLAIIGYGLALAAHVMFAWELGDAANVLIAGLLVAVGGVFWFRRRHLLRDAGRAMRLLPLGLLLLYSASVVVPCSAWCYVWRHEAELLAQVAAVRRGESVVSPFGHEIRVEHEPLRVYWPRFATALGSRGLAYDPSGGLGALPGHEHVFEEAIVFIQQIADGWFIVHLT